MEGWECQLFIEASKHIFERWGHSPPFFFFCFFLGLGGHWHTLMELGALTSSVFAYLLFGAVYWCRRPFSILLCPCEILLCAEFQNVCATAKKIMGNKTSQDLSSRCFSDGYPILHKASGFTKLTWNFVLIKWIFKTVQFHCITI